MAAVAQDQRTLDLASAFRNLECRVLDISGAVDVLTVAAESPLHTKCILDDTIRRTFENRLEGMEIIACASYELNALRYAMTNLMDVCGKLEKEYYAALEAG